MWNHDGTDSCNGLGITRRNLDRLWVGKSEGYLYSVTDALVCPDEFFSWDDSCGNNPGFLPSMTSDKDLPRMRINFGLTLSAIISFADTRYNMALLNHVDVDYVDCIAAVAQEMLPVSKKRTCSELCDTSHDDQSIQHDKSDKDIEPSIVIVIDD
jgi:hypothetical protein